MSFPFRPKRFVGLADACTPRISHDMALRPMKDNLPQTAADAGAALSTVSVAAYTFSDLLNDAALVVAIVSGSLAAAWHVYKFYQEYRLRKGGNNASKSDKKP